MAIANCVSQATLDHSEGQPFEAQTYAPWRPGWWPLYTRHPAEWT